MKNISGPFLLLMVLSPIAIATTAEQSLAQQPPANPRKEHIQYCVNKLPVQLAQVKQIKGVMDQENLTGLKKLEALGQILTPDQKKQLKQCMQQPMPPS